MISSFHEWENQEEEEQGTPQVRKACLCSCQQRDASYPTTPVTAFRKQPSQTYMLQEHDIILFLNEQMGELKNGMLVLLSFHKQHAIPEVCKVYH